MTTNAKEIIFTHLDHPYFVGNERDSIVERNDLVPGDVVFLNSGVFYIIGKKRDYQYSLYSRTWIYMPDEFRHLPFDYWSIRVRDVFVFPFLDEMRKSSRKIMIDKSGVTFSYDTEDKHDSKHSQDTHLDFNESALNVINAAKDFSERTFDSFLNAVVFDKETVIVRNMIDFPTPKDLGKIGNWVECRADFMRKLYFELDNILQSVLRNITREYCNPEFDVILE